MVGGAPRIGAFESEASELALLGGLREGERSSSKSGLRGLRGAPFKAGAFESEARAEVGRLCAPRTPSFVGVSSGFASS